MIESELTRILKSTKGKVGILLIFLFPLVDFMQHIYGDIIAFGDFESYHLNHPAYSSFLAGSSMGHFTQILLFWILPLYFLLLYSDSYTTDRNYGYLKCLLSRTGRKNYYKNKFKIAFLAPIILMFSSFFKSFDEYNCVS